MLGRSLPTRRQTLWTIAAGLFPQGLRRSGVAFHYAALFTPRELDWYSRFAVLVTGGILEQGQTSLLRSGPAQLVAYEWSSAFYPGDPVSASPGWQREVLANPGTWLLNANPVGGGAAAPGRKALWYDFGCPQLIQARAGYLSRLLDVSGYDGLFFDTIGFEHLPKPVQVEFGARHPDLDYNRCQGEFFRELRLRIGPAKIVFLNQGYRHPDLFLPHADYDLSESYFTYVGGSSTVFRSWDSTRKPWEAIRIPMEKLVVPAKRRYPGVKFVHLNYAAGGSATVRRAIRFSFACARLWDDSSYLVSPASSDEEDEVYSRDLGEPLGPAYFEDRTLGVAWREYSGGIVAVNTGVRTARIPGFGLELPDPPNGYVFPARG